MSKESLVDKVHSLLNSYSKAPDKLNRQIGLLMITHGKEAILASLIECSAIAYSRLFSNPERSRECASGNHIDLVRQIMIKLRDKTDLKPAPVLVDGYEPLLVARHMERLHAGGLIEGNVSRTIGSAAPLVLATDLSLEGHTFLAALENKQVWTKLKEVLSPNELASLPVKKLSEVAVELAVQWAKRKLGLAD
ncbi:DUF2513 domain-containing protein [Agrobacterium vitis]